MFIMLVFSAITIQKGRCLYPQGAGASGTRFPDDRLSLARFLRIENAKALHITDMDAALYGICDNRKIVREIVNAPEIHIPVQYAGGVRACSDVGQLLNEVGVKRVVLDPGALDKCAEAGRLLEEFDLSNLVFDLRVADRRMVSDCSPAEGGESAVEYCRRISRFRIARALYTDVEAERNKTAADLSAAMEIAEAAGLILTLNGGVRNRADLKRVEALKGKPVDSIVLADPLYSDAFPCQVLWRMAEDETSGENGA